METPNVERGRERRETGWGMERANVRERVAAAADPAALRNNPFRVLDVPTDASGEVLRRAMDQCRRERPPAGGDAPAVDSAADALRRLRDPQQRLVDELLWFWSEEDEADTGHNTAIAKLHAFVEEGEDPLTGWGEALAAMTRTLRAPGTVAHLTARATALNGPGVTAADAQVLVDEVRALLPLIGLRMAARAHDDGRTATASLLARRVRSDVDAPLAAEAARIVAEPSLRHLREEAQTATHEAKAAPRRGAEYAQTLLARANAERSYLDALLDPADPARAGVTDEVVASVLACVTAYYAETGDARTVGPILRSAIKLDPDPTVRTQLDEKLKILEPQAAGETRRLVRPRPVSDWSTADLLADRGGADPRGRHVLDMDTLHALFMAQQMQSSAQQARAVPTGGSRLRLLKVAAWVVIIVAVLCLGVGWVGTRDLNKVRAFERPPVTVRIVGTTCDYWVGTESRDSTCEGTWQDPDDGSSRRGTVQFAPGEDLPDVRGEQARAHVFGDRAYVGDAPSEGWEAFAKLTPWLIALGVLGLVAGCVALVGRRVLEVS